MSLVSRVSGTSTVKPALWWQPRGPCDRLAITKITRTPHRRSGKQRSNINRTNDPVRVHCWFPLPVAFLNVSTPAYAFTCQHQEKQLLIRRYSSFLLVKDTLSPTDSSLFATTPLYVLVTFTYQHDLKLTTRQGTLRLTTIQLYRRPSGAPMTSP